MGLVAILSNPRLTPLAHEGDRDDYRLRSVWSGPLVDPVDEQGYVANLVVILERIASGEHIPLHRHTIDEVIVVEAGEVEVQLGDEQRVVTGRSVVFVPAGVAGVVVARLFLGAGEGSVYVAGSAWIVDLAPAERRGRVIGLYGLAIWGGLALGPPLGELVLHASSFDTVWALAAAAPLVAALIAIRIPERYQPRRDEPAATLLAREALRPGLGLALAIVGYAAMAAFVVLHLDERAIGHGAAVFTAFAATVIAVRVVGGWLPDRYGPIRCAVGAALVEAAGLVTIAAAESLAAAVVGATAMGAGFSLLFPSLALLVVNRVPVQRRGAAMGTFTAFFDLGMGVGGPLTGAAAALGGYSAAFGLAAVCAIGTVTVALTLRRVSAALPATASP